MASATRKDRFLGINEGQFKEIVMNRELRQSTLPATRSGSTFYRLPDAATTLTRKGANADAHNTSHNDILNAFEAARP